MPIHGNFWKSPLEHRGAKEGKLPTLGNDLWLLKNLLHSCFLRGKIWQVNEFVFSLSKTLLTPLSGISLWNSHQDSCSFCFRHLRQRRWKRTHGLKGVPHDSGCVGLRSQEASVAPDPGEYKDCCVLVKFEGPGQQLPCPRLSSVLTLRISVQYLYNASFWNALRRLTKFSELWWNVTLFSTCKIAFVATSSCKLLVLV